MRRAVAIALAAASLLTQSHLASAAPSPLGPAFPNKGDVYMTTVAASNPITTTASFATGFAPIPGFGIPITIPKGRIADVQILFTGEMNSANAEYVAAVIDGSPTAPGIVQAFWAFPGGGATSQAANFTAFLTAGDHTLQMQWGGLGGQQFMSLRNMLVIVNLRHVTGNPQVG